MPDFWKLTEDPPDYAKDTAGLAHWSTNYDWPTPFTLFCDLIGFNGEEHGAAFFLPRAVEKSQEEIDHDSGEVSAWDAKPRDYERAQGNLYDQRLGFMEIGKLADALNEYAARPADVMEFVRQLTAPADEEGEE